MNSRILYALLLAAVPPAGAEAATRTWPGGPGCTGTLQACVDAATAGDRIEIATATPIDETLVLPARSLTLTAADGFKPAFVGVGVVIEDVGASGDITVSISRLRFINGYVRASASTAGTATFDLRELVLTRAPGATGQGISVRAGGGTVNAMLYDNRVSGQPTGSNDGLIELSAGGGTLNASAYYNHVASSSTELVSGSGILVDVAGGGASVKLHANEVRGGFSRAGIFVSEGLFAPAASTVSARVYNNVVVGAGAVGTGIAFVPTNGTINAQAINNTVTRVQTALSVANWNSAVTPVVDSLVKNNLLKGGQAMFVNPAMVATTENDYNLFDGATVNFTPGPNSISGPAGIVSDVQPRLAAGSPAIDAADTATLGLGVIINGLPATDADGLRRIKNTGSNDADIGAFESGDVNFMHTAAPATIAGHVTWISHPAVDAVPAADLFATPNFGGANPHVAVPDPFGTWYSGGQWSLFNENVAAMPAWADYNLFVPAPGSGVFRHVAGAANTSGWTTQLDHSSVNDQPDRIVLATQNYTAGPQYNPHPIGVFYFALGGPGSWLVANLDMAADGDLPVGAGFSIYAQEPSPNAFRVTATAGNTTGSTLRLDHPLLDNTSCAQPVLTRMFNGVAVSGAFDVDYFNGHWYVFGYSGIPLGTQFNVLVNPAQVAACNDVIFADRFEL